MSEGSAHTRQTNDTDNGLPEKRLRFLMAVVWITGTLTCLIFFNWRETFGFAVGGALSYFNFSWLKSSTGSILTQASNGIPTARSARFILRYAVIGAVISVLYGLKLVSVPAAIFGLLSFTFAILLEAIYQFYLAIVKGEDLS